MSHTSIFKEVHMNAKELKEIIDDLTDKHSEMTRTAIVMNKFLMENRTYRASNVAQSLIVLMKEYSAHLSLAMDDLRDFIEEL